VQRPEAFNVDLADPQGLAEKLASIRKTVDEKRDVLREAREELSYWETLERRLAALTGGDSSERRFSGKSIRDRVREIVLESDLPIDTNGIVQLMPGANRKTVSWNLWDLERRGDIQRIASGVYARPDFKESLLIGDDRDLAAAPAPGVGEG